MTRLFVVADMSTLSIRRSLVTSNDKDKYENFRYNNSRRKAS
jgi:hypothetical protein